MIYQFYLNYYYDFEIQDRLRGKQKKILPNNNSSITVPIAVGKKD